MLRISKKEKQSLYRTNASIRRKIKKIKTTFNIDVSFNVLTPKQFTSRTQVNLYKEQAKTFLNPYTHRYVKMGIRRGGKFYFGVPYEEYKEVHKQVMRQNAYARREMQKAKSLPLYEGSLKTATTSGAFIEQNKKNIGLKSQHQTFIPIKIQKETISTKETWEKLKYGIKQFHSRKAYNKRNQQARDNYISALLNTFGNNALPIADILMEFSPREFAQLYESNVLIDFDYIYDYTQALSQLIDITHGIMKFIGEGGLDKGISLSMADKIVNLSQIIDLDSSEILSRYIVHTRKFTYKGNLYQGSYREKELEMIDTGNITESILKKSTYLGKSHGK